jgi:hypothetical protein
MGRAAIADVSNKGEACMKLLHLHSFVMMRASRTNKDYAAESWKDRISADNASLFTNLH